MSSIGWKALESRWEKVTQGSNTRMSSFTRRHQTKGTGPGLIFEGRKKGLSKGTFSWEGALEAVIDARMVRQEERERKENSTLVLSPMGKKDGAFDKAIRLRRIIRNNKLDARGTYVDTFSARSRKSQRGKESNSRASSARG